jgi:hypothetical protein
MLTLCDELFLLSLHEKKDTVGLSSSMELPYAMAGALLLALCLDGKVRLEGKKVIPVNANISGGGSELQNELLGKIAAAKKPRKTSDWVLEFGGKEKKLRKAALTSLVQHGILREEEKNFLWVIPYTGYSEQDSTAKFALKAHLRSVALNHENLDEHAAALLSLVRASNLLDHLFTRDELRFAKRRVEGLVKDEAVGQAVQETIDSINAAIAATVVIASSSSS